MIKTQGDTISQHTPNAPTNAGDGYVPEFDYGKYLLTPNSTYPAPTAGNSGVPWIENPLNMPPKMFLTTVLGRLFSLCNLDAVLRPGITGTQVSTVASTTDWKPQYTIQQAAIQNALKQKTSMN